MYGLTYSIVTIVYFVQYQLYCFIASYTLEKVLIRRRVLFLLTHYPFGIS